MLPSREKKKKKSSYLTKEKKDQNLFY